MARRTTYTGGALAPTVQSAMPEDNALRVGTVIAVSGSDVTVDVAGGPPTVGVLGSYDPVVGDIVALVRAGATWLLLGRIGAGVSGIEATGQSRVAFGRIVNPTLQNLTTTPTLITGFTVNVTAPVGSCDWTATAFFEMEKLTADNSTAIGFLRRDGVLDTTQALIEMRAEATGRATIGQCWGGTGLAAGVHVFEIYGSVTAVNASWRMDNLHSSLNVELWR